MTPTPVPEYTYTVKFNVDGGSPVPADIAVKASQEACSIELPELKLEKAGYQFDGWFTEKDGVKTYYRSSQTGSTNLVELTKDNPVVTLNANWIKVYCQNIIYDNNDGGAAPTEVPTFSTEQKTLVVKKETPTRAGYYFKEWNTKKDGTGAGYAPEATVAEADTVNGVILYAVWKALPVANKEGQYTYVLTLDPNGGRGSAQKLSIVTVEKSAKFYVGMSTPTMDGYQFAGWDMAKDGSGKKEDRFTKEVILSYPENELTLYATWEKVSS